ncbi:MAG TPA: sulfatase-like hydrolase/transferase [Pyrinomonadaceae bacterium]|nr:sulfatase-like hydrolase/transferase [Pyrinomonadaceae bacterium]
MAGVSRREFIAGAAAITAAAGGHAQTPEKAGIRPNILFILADDMAWGDLSCYGRPDYQTPNLDRLAAQGMRFTNAYSAAPVCTPTRVGFLSGRYPARLPVGLEEPIHERSAIGDRVKTTGIPVSHPTVSSLIKAAGYDTALVGKWHLGDWPDFGPLKFGFDEFFGNMSGAVDHFTHKDMTANLDLYEGEVPVERIGYMTDLLTERAVDYVKRPHKKPFYLSLHYTAPHWPWEGPNDKAFSDAINYGPAGFRAGGSLKVFAEMMKSMDAGIGRVLDTLKSSGLDRNTLVIFTSDNGGAWFSYHWPFRGQKMDLFEGGVRVPAIVRWSGVTTAGKVSDQPVITMDWTATMIAAAGNRPDPNYPLDGQNIVGVLNGKQPIFDRPFFWRTKRQGAMRHGKWKYVREGKNEFLFDLSVDEREQADFSAAQPSVLEHLRGEFKKWESEVISYPPTNP